jgi:hypothetical protein
MSSKHSVNGPGHKNTGHKTIVVGKSSVTGQYVVKPASKHGSITLKEANTAARAVSSDHKGK